MRKISRLRRGLGVELIGGVIVSIAILLSACEQRSTSPTRAGSDYPWIVPAVDFNVPEELKEAYRVDAALLTLRKMHEIGEAFDEQVQLPKDLFNTLYSALIHVYNTRLPARDTVVSICEVHTYCFWEPYILGLDVDTSYEWVKAWRDGKRLTGNLEVDRLMLQYDLRLSDYWEAPWEIVYVSLRSATPLNMSALAKKFSAIKGVNEAWDQPYCIGDGNDIIAKAERNFWQLEYSIGWGDCLAGCALRHFWNFRVYPNGKVEYEGSYGDPGPYGCGY